MKQIDKATERKLYWLFTPMALVVAALILDLWFGVDLNFLSWCYPAILGSALIVFTGFAIAAIRQKCWGELAIALFIAIFMLLNMSNFFVDLLLPGH